jgi:hypothetical protein
LVRQIFRGDALGGDFVPRGLETVKTPPLSHSLVFDVVFKEGGGALEALDLVSTACGMTEGVVLCSPAEHGENVKGRSGEISGVSIWGMRVPELCDLLS